MFLSAGWHNRLKSNDAGNSFGAYFVSVFFTRLPPFLRILCAGKKIGVAHSCCFVISMKIHPGKSNWEDCLFNPTYWIVRCDLERSMQKDKARRTKYSSHKTSQVRLFPRKMRIFFIEKVPLGETRTLANKRHDWGKSSQISRVR